MAEEFVEFGLYALAHAGEHERHQGRQRQFAPSLKRGWMIRMAGAVTELIRVQMVGKVGEQGGRRHGKRMKIKRPSLAAALLASKKETSARLRLRKACAESSTISQIGQ